MNSKTRFIYLDILLESYISEKRLPKDHAEAVSSRPKGVFLDISGIVLFPLVTAPRCDENSVCTVAVGYPIIYLRNAMKGHFFISM